jgi:hypothetical protein
VKRFIVLRATDGLGNQLFQYAFARSLALDLERNLLVDFSTFAGAALTNPEWRKFRLDRFPIKAQTSVWPIHALLRRFASPENVLDLRESRFFHFDEKMQDRIGRDRDRKWILISGYWQSYKYFDRHREVLRGEMSPPPARRKALFSLAPGEQAVLLHVRRGDLNSQASIFGMCPVDYYQTAIRYVRQRVSQPKFIVFSDDTAWVQDSLCPALPELRENYQVVEKADDLSTISAMFQCHHFIIANSTFSWWPAYFGDLPNKIVIAPKRWLRDPDWEVELYPEGWVQA